MAAAARQKLCAMRTTNGGVYMVNLICTQKQPGTFAKPGSRGVLSLAIRAYGRSHKGGSLCWVEVVSLSLATY